MTDRHDTDDAAPNNEPGLEGFFEAARATPPPVPPALMARVQADAGAAQPRVRVGWLQMLGGMPGVGGLVTATCLGVWIGVAPPQQLPDLGGLALGIEDAGETDVAGFGWDLEIEEG